jgi:hypothetical protein
VRVGAPARKQGALTLPRLHHLGLTIQYCGASTRRSTRCANICYHDYQNHPRADGVAFPNSGSLRQPKMIVHQRMTLTSRLDSY